MAREIKLRKAQSKGQAIVGDGLCEKYPRAEVYKLIELLMEDV
jgi:hypothetical protein